MAKEAIGVILSVESEGFPGEIEKGEEDATGPVTRIEIRVKRSLIEETSHFCAFDMGALILQAPR